MRGLTCPACRDVPGVSIYGAIHRAAADARLRALRAVMDAGASVVYIDEEGGPQLAVERLVALGADPEVVAERLHYFAFEARRWDEVDLAALDAVIAQASAGGTGLGLGVLDSLPDFLAAAALSENDAAEVTAFFASVCGRFRRAGAASLVLDRTTPSSAPRSPGAVRWEMRYPATSLKRSWGPWWA